MDAKVVKWLKTAVFAALGGGVAATITSMMDPTEYHFPQDVGSGKLWVHFFSGAGITFLALLMKSPIGQQVMSSYKDAQSGLQESKQEVQNFKAEIGKASPQPDKESPPSKPSKS